MLREIMIFHHIYQYEEKTEDMLKPLFLLILEGDA